MFLGLGHVLTTDDRVGRKNCIDASVLSSRVVRTEHDYRPLPTARNES